MHPAYTRVADFLPWIQSKLANQCMCKPKTTIQSGTVQEIEVAKNPTDLCLQPAKNSTCDCGNNQLLLNSLANKILINFNYFNFIFDST